MPAYNFPTLIWEDYEGWFTASLLDDEQFTSATAPTAAEARLQLKEFLGYVYKEEPWRDEPDFLTPNLLTIRVDVRPEYKVEKRVFPSESAIALRVPCVTGKQAGGLRVCAMPTLALRFFYYEEQSLKDLVRHYVQEKCKGMTPQQIARLLPPKAFTLDEITLHLNRKYKPWRYETDIKQIQTVAEPLGDKSVRRQFSRAWGRETIVADLVKRSQHEKANVLLVGEPGVGKTAVLIEAVRAIERTPELSEEDDDEIKPKHRYWLTGAARLIAGMKYLGEWQERVEDIIKELANINGVLCVDNLLDLVRTGGHTPGDSIAAFLLPFLQRGELRLIAEATSAELDACRRLLPGFADVFQILKLEPFGRDEAMNALNRVAANLQQNLNIEIAEGAVELTYNLFRRFVPYQAFPGKTVPFLRDLCERSALTKSDHLSKQTVIEQFIRQTGLPELFLRDELPLERSEVIAELQMQVIGQPDAVQTAADVIVTFKAGLNDPNRPLAVLLFAGPTGVGKTELAKAVSRFLFGHGETKDRLVRLDMSEYSGWNAAERLRTAPDGSPSELIKKMREQPFVVLLLDEIEKADSEVFDVLLSVFDEGRLTDRYGRTTTFRSAVIVMTSNLGAEKFSTLGFGEMSQPSYNAEAMSFFRPEFFNRMDGVVRFAPLNATTIREITQKELAEIANREGMLKAGLKLQWSDEVLDLIAREGFDPRFGARPLQRTLETLVVAPLARYLLKNPELKNVTLRLEVAADGLVKFTSMP
jgi:ATP-dependent Clp protease ATP-binding subunit ClpC